LYTVGLPERFIAANVVTNPQSEIRNPDDPQFGRSAIRNPKSVLRSPLVATYQLTKRYAEVTALADCTLSVPAGQVCGLLGPNGSGKTTLLRLLMGFLRPSAGRAEIDGLDCYRRPVDVHRRVAYLPGEVRLFRNRRGRNILRYFSSVRPDGNLQRATQIADRLGLDLNRQVARSSTGMRQKLALAATLSLDVPLIILDEPTSNLDPSVRSQVLAMIRETRDAGRTVVFSSHVLSEVEQVCDRVIMLRGGRLVHDQRMSELRRQHRIRAQLEGPAAVLPEDLKSDARVVSQHDGRLVVDVAGALAAVLKWLATLAIEEVTVEPMGLQTIYDKYHSTS